MVASHSISYYNDISFYFANLQRSKFTNNLVPKLAELNTRFILQNKYKDKYTKFLAPSKNEINDKKIPDIHDIPITVVNNALYY